jgi:lipopolysaccharide export system protein LptA
MRPSDPETYTKLVQESIDLRTRKALEAEPAHQKRKGVRKDIWTQNETCHFRIQSADSDLIISQKKDKMEAIEHLKSVKGSSDEFKLVADVGIYTYPSHQFIAQKNCLFTQNGNRIAGSQIHFDLAQEIVRYDNPVGMLAQGPFHFQAKQLIWDKKSNRLDLIDEVQISKHGFFNLLANRGTVDLDELKPKGVILEGNVRLIASPIQGKESYAVADTLVYDPEAKTLLFSADRRVLFWQDGLTLSASEILIREDQSVEGHGDVHFTFNFEEQNYIDELFKQYL